MKKFLIGLTTGLLLAGFALFVLFFAAMRLGERRPTVQDGSTLVLRMEGVIPEQPAFEIPFPPFDQSAPMTMYESWDLLRKAAADSRVKAILLMPHDLKIGWAKTQEIRDGLVEFKKSGKPVYAWLRSPGNKEYFIATAADRIYVAPEDFLDLKGLRAELTFFRRTLDKLGIAVEIEHIGKYKDAGDSFTRTSISPETREVMSSILDGVYGSLLGAIAESRQKSVEEVRAMMDEGPFLSADAAAKNLIDGRLYEDQVHQELAKELGQSELKRLPHRTYLRVPARSLGLEGDRRIALVVGQGAIMRGDTQPGLFEGDGIYSEPFIRMLRQVRNNRNIQGVVVRVDSPGGDALASDDILRELRLLSRAKPTVISMSDVAASGGYYIAMTGDPILTYPNTITGSIGVIFGKVTLRGFYDKIGIQKDILTRGRYADIDSDYRPLTEEGRRKLRTSLEAIYEGFLERVAEGRKKERDEVHALAQGRVWLGAQAEANGLVDEIGGFARAIALVKERAKIPADEQVRVDVYPAKRSLFDVWLSRPSEPTVDGRLRALLRDYDLGLWLRGGVMRVMPYKVLVY
ncbi:MAG: signal peptide peptidase SppA [Bryobacteraceae bacterium]